MKNLLFIFGVLTGALLVTTPAHAYIMSMQSYSQMFERADVVVIATPLSTQESNAESALEVDQPKSVTDLIKTVDTRFQVAYVLKGSLDANTFHFLHLSLKEKRKSRIMVFGEVGTFFVDFESKWSKKRSFILFMKKRADGTYSPAWRPIEGSRGIIAVEKEGEL